MSSDNAEYLNVAEDHDDGGNNQLQGGGGKAVDSLKRRIWPMFVALEATVALGRHAHNCIFAAVLQRE